MNPVFADAFCFLALLNEQAGFTVLLK